MSTLIPANSTPDFGFNVEIVQRNEKGDRIYAGYGFRVVEVKTTKGKVVYQLRAKDNLLLEWGLLGTFRNSTEVKRRVAQLDFSTEEKSLMF